MESINNPTLPADIKNIKQKNCSFGRKSKSPLADLTKDRLADAKAQQEDNSRKDKR